MATLKSLAGKWVAQNDEGETRVFNSQVAGLAFVSKGPPEEVAQPPVIQEAPVVKSAPPPKPSPKPKSKAKRVLKASSPKKKD